MSADPRAVALVKQAIYDRRAIAAGLNPHALAFVKQAVYERRVAAAQQAELQKAAAMEQQAVQDAWATKQAALAKLARFRFPRVFNPWLLKGLAAAIRPQVKMPKQPWLAKLLRPFVSTKAHDIRANGMSREAVARILGDRYNAEFAAAGGRVGGGAPGNASGSVSVSGSVPVSGSTRVSGSSAGGPEGNLLDYIVNNRGVIDTITRHRLRPGRVAAALGAAGLLGGGTYMALRDGKQEPSSDSVLGAAGLSNDAALGAAGLLGGGGVTYTEPKDGGTEPANGTARILSALWANPDTRAAIIGAALGGIGGSTIGGGSAGDRVLRGIAGTIIGGSLGYGSSYGTRKAKEHWGN